MTGAMKMYRCPACNAQLAPDQQFCACGTELTVLVEMTDLTDAWFNGAVNAAGEGRYGRALELISACCVAAPDDAEARYVQAQILGRLGLPAEGLEALEECERLEPDRADPNCLRLALKQQWARKWADEDRRSHSRGRTKKRKEARAHHGQGSRY